MSITEWKLEKDLCRCCHSEGTFKSLSAADYAPGSNEELEVYLLMLRNSLAIELAPVTGPLVENANSICELCIARLQDAHSFKQQVLKCEEIFQNLYTRNCIKVQCDAKIKDELSYSDEGEYLAPHEDNFDLCDAKPKTEAKEKGPKKKRNGAKKRGRPRKGDTATDADATDDEGTGKKPRESCKTSHYRLLHSDYRCVGALLQCARCDKTFNSTNGLRHHVKSAHLALARYSCPHCAMSFRTIAPFTTHKLTEHGIDERQKCNACDAIFNTKTQLRKHINGFHMLGVKHKCPHCEYECFSVEALYKHKFKHKTVKDYHCKYCRKSFLRKATLDLHERIHTGDRRKVCSQCGQAFVQKASLNYHMAKYHPEVNF